MCTEDGYVCIDASDLETNLFLIDHHCPWINNCVGHYNYGHFIRFLFFVDVACSYHIAMVTRRVLYASKGGYWVRSNLCLCRMQINERQDEPSTLELIMIILNYVACIPVLLAVGCFRYEFNPFGS